MLNKDKQVDEGGEESASSVLLPEWSYDIYDDIIKQHSEAEASESEKNPLIGDKEPLSVLEAEYQSSCPVWVKKIKFLEQKFAAIRRARGDGNCFYRCFMFSYLEHILETRDKPEVDRIKANVEESRRTLMGLGYADFTFEDIFELFLEQLECVLQGTDSISHEELVRKCRCPSHSNSGELFKIMTFMGPLALTLYSRFFCSVVMFLRFVTAGEMRKRSEFFEPFVMGLASSNVEQFCRSSVLPMAEESDHVHIIALSSALGVPIRVVYLDRSTSDNDGATVNHHDFVPSSGDSSASSSSSSSEVTEPFMVLLYRPGHYDILYPK
ncbi:hypothetical protein SAY87_001757 [Trapa incisa]|uniref:Ubiquitin thioesterase n=1 Tax=Trapa incisa TaxID=236973 RepID=A0AAN7JYK6_9MYRT|nr:hypothetical protein SAY87_001757 [Trapa incisa]